MYQNSNESELRARSQAILQARVRNIRKVALAAAIVPLAVAAAAGGSAAADASAKSAQNHRVKYTVTKVADQKFKYEFTLINASLPGASGGAQGTTDIAPSEEGPARPWIVDWQLPIFDAADVSEIKAPKGWAFEIIKPTAETPTYNSPASPWGKHPWVWSATEDPLLKKEDQANLYGPNPGVFAKPPLVVHWYSVNSAAEGKPMPANPLGSLEMMKGFEFVSKYAETAAPFLPVYYNQQDVASLAGKAATPNSPSFQKAASVKVSSAQ